MAEKLKIILFYGSTREGRLVERVGAHVKNVVESHGMDPIIFDPEEMPELELFKTPLHFYRNPADIPVWMDKANDRIKSADGFIIITPEYNGELPSALTNMINTFPPWSFRHRPVALVTYSMGQWGGARVMVNARHYSTELGMLPIPTHAIIPVAQNAFETDGTCKVERTAGKIATTVNELKWYVNALKNQKAVEALPEFKPEWA